MQAITLARPFALTFTLTFAFALLGCTQEASNGNIIPSDTSDTSDASHTSDTAQTADTTIACDSITTPSTCHDSPGCTWWQDNCGGAGACASQKSVQELAGTSQKCSQVLCSEISDATSCASITTCTWYETDCGVGSGTCADQKAAPPPIKKCTIAPCEYRLDPTECVITDDCRWLTPGCDEGMDAPNVTAGCYPTTDCTQTECQPDYACTARVYDPCAGSDCDACGAITNLCEAAPPPPPSDCRLRAASECEVDNTCQWLKPGCEANPVTEGCYPSGRCDAELPCAEGLTCTTVNADTCPDGAPCAFCGQDISICL